MLEKLLSQQSWEEFLKAKLDNEYASLFLIRSFKKILKSGKHQEICQKLVGGTYTFTTPRKHLIAKNSSAKRRVVYSYLPEEMLVLKHISFLLYEYDYLFSRCLYSFRKKTGVKSAINAVRRKRNLNKLYGYKLDISNYFNSIDIDMFLKDLKETVSDDVYSLYEELYKNNDVVYRNKVIQEQKGAMAGMPLSSFAANFYIRKIDEYFMKEKVFYLRYADDVIFFTKTSEEREKYSEIIKSLLAEKKLKVNHDKETLIEPGQDFEFLGFAFSNKTVDISRHAKSKIKDKIKRQARRIRQWCKQKKLPFEKGLIAINKKFNQKFFGKSYNETSWSYWYFPMINTTNVLKEVDAYFQQEQRFLFTGRHNKSGYRKCPYSKLKECGYRSLVHEYYEFIKRNK